jgi:hypothetical protein
MNLFERLTTARELFLNGFDRRRPDEGFGVLIPCCQKLRDRLSQIFDASERAPSHSFGSQFSTPALDQIEPIGPGGNKVRDKSGVTLQPPLHVGMLVRARVVPHPVHGSLAGKRLVQPAQESQKLLMAVPLVALADDPTLQDFPRRTQHRRASWCHSALLHR